MTDPRRTLTFLPTQHVDIHVTFRGREWSLVSRLVGVVLLPFLRWRGNRRRRMWQPHVDRIIKEVEAELPGGRSHPDFRATMATRVAVWFAEHPEAEP
jgi:hypothetical protein